MKVWGTELKRKLEIKWKIFVCMLVFVFVLIGILWIFQTVYLEEFYKHIKINELYDAAENISEVVDDKEIEDAINTICTSYDISVVIVDEDMNEVVSSKKDMRDNMEIMNKLYLLRLYEHSLSLGGEYFIDNKSDNRLDKEEFDNQFMDDSHMPDDNMTGVDKFSHMNNMPEKINMESVMLVKILDKQDGSTYVAYIYSIITPIGATVHTIRVQLIYISVIMILLSLIIAFIISINISRPIEKITESAKELAKGNYDVKFEKNGYKEIAELSETLEYTAGELAKTEKLQQEIIANVSHDLRTPLTMITAYSEVMRDLPGENTPENIQVVIDEANRLTNLVNDMMDISKLQAGVTTLELKKYDLTESIKSVINRYSKLVLQDGYDIEFDYDHNVFCEADEFKIYQVIYNLVNNAINYSTDNKTIRVVQKDFGSIVRIEVIDKGDGIPKDKIKDVFERYYKIDKTHKRAVMGTGLGLSIVKNILELHHANYGVDSEVGKGSTFWFELKK